MILEQSEHVIQEVKKAFMGKDDIIRRVLATIYAGGHILLEDSPGVGKTTLALAFSRVLGLDYKRIQFTTDTLPSDITGFTMYNRQNEQFEYHEGAAMCNLLLADEINRTSPKTQSALLEAMEERRVTVDGVTRPLPTPFICIATQNPLGTTGTQALPSSPFYGSSFHWISFSRGSDQDLKGQKIFQPSGRDPGSCTGRKHSGDPELSFCS